MELSQKEEAETILAKISLTLQNSKLPKDNFSDDERKSLKELQSDTLTVIWSADKGISTVILNCEDYLQKCMDHKTMIHINYLQKILQPKSKARHWSN